jgi:hypothetical protein
MGYSFLTFAQMKVQLAERQEDASNIYWKDAENALYLQEALRTWQSLTHCWRDTMNFPTVPNQAWYDLTAQSGTLIPFTQKDSDLISVMLYQLIEPQLAAGVYVGTDMFTLDDFTQAMQRRRDQFLLETGMITKRSVMNLPSPPISRVPLADTIMDVRRVAFIDPAGLYTTLWKTDEWRASAYKTGWENAPQSPPSAFSIAGVPPITLKIIPPGANPGTAELVTISAGAALDPSTGVLLGIPDDFVWVLRFGAMADLLSREGQSKDPQRADYCEQRWNEGIQIARATSSILTAYVNGVATFPTAVHALSTYRPGWQNQVGKPPDTVASMSWNLLALSDVPDTGPYSVTVEVMENAPVPVNNSDPVQVSREELDVILDYAQHLAAFKQGGAEFVATLPLYKNFVELALVRNERLKAAIPYFDILESRSTVQEKESPRRIGIEQTSI